VAGKQGFGTFSKKLKKSYQNHLTDKKSVVEWLQIKLLTKLLT
jgi:hypothetical protein